MKKIRTYLIRFSKVLTSLFRPRLFRALIFNRVLAAVEHRPVLTKDLKTIIDIGANRGQFALAAREFTNAKIYSFEPLNFPGKVWESIFFADHRARLFKSAISNNIGRAKINLSARDDSSSLLPIGQNQITQYPGTQSIGVIEIDVAPLSYFLDSEQIKPPAMLKVDVQGFEMQALLGSESLLSSFDWIYCECSFIELYSGQSLAYEIIDWLKQHNFIFSGVFNLSYTNSGKPVQADFLFKRNSI